MTDTAISLELSARTERAIRDVLDGRPRRFGLLLFAGPAVIASIAYMDPGNFATNIQAGAKYGYALLWVVLGANVVAMLFQALSAKLGIVTGRNLAELCRDQFPLPLVYALWIVSEVAAMATDLAEFLGGAIGLALLLHLPLIVGMGITAISAVQDVYAQNFREIPAWEKAVQQGHVATMRGYHLSSDDQIRREVISRLLCHTVIIKDEISRQFNIDFDEYFAPELQRLKHPQEDGLVQLTTKDIRSTWLGRIFIRNLAMIFDPYLEKQQLAARPLFSKTL